MSLTTAEWLHLYEELQNVHLQRNLDYYRLHNIYHGNYYDYLRPDIHDGAGRLILRDNRRSMDARRPLVANLLKGIVDDYVSLVGQLPDVKVPPPGTDQGAQDFADRLEKYHYGVWHASQMRMQLKDGAWWNSVMGGHAGLIWPDFERRHSIIRFTAPYMFYGVTDFYNPYRLSKAIIAERFDYLAVKDVYPNVELPIILQQIDEKYYSYASRDRKVEVLKCFDKDEVVTIIGKRQAPITGTSLQRRKDGQSPYHSQEVGRAKHNTGFCPVIALQNIRIPGEIRGHSDIEQAIGLNEHVNFIMNAYEEYILQDIYSPIIIEDPQKFDEDQDFTSPRTTIPVNAGGKAYRLSPGSGNQTVQGELQRTQAFIEHNTGDPQVRTEGRLRSSITTGRGIEKAQGPHFGRIEYRHDIYSHYLEDLNTMSVEMTQAIFPNEDIVMFAENRLGSVTQFKMNTDELQHYGFNKVIYSPSMNMGASERAVFVLQLLGSDPPLIDQRTAIEFLGITDHPDEMIKRVAAMLEEQIARKKSAETQAQPPGPQSPLEQNAKMNAGATPEQPGAPGGGGAPMPSPGGGAPGPIGSPAALPGQEGAPPTGLDQNIPPGPPPESPGALGGGLMAEVRRVIIGIKTTQPVYAREAGDKVEIFAESFVDARRIKRAIRKVFGDRVSVRTTKNPPPGAVPIGGGGGGRGPQGPQEAQQG